MTSRFYRAFLFLLAMLDCRIVFANSSESTKAAADPLSWCQQLLDAALKISCESELKIWCQSQRNATAPEFCRALLPSQTTPPTASPTPKPSAPHTRSVQAYRLSQLKTYFGSLLKIQGTSKPIVAGPRASIQSPSAKLSPSEINRISAAQFFMSDIKLTYDQWTTLMKYGRSGDNDSTKKQRSKRKLGEEPTFQRWPEGPIQYALDANLHEGTRTAVVKAIRMWQQNTCVQFRQMRPYDEHFKEGILFIEQGQSCSSFVGKVGGLQTVTVAWPHCATAGLVAHEIGHALGLMHEQNRPVAFKHLSVDFEKLDPVFHDLFVRLESSLLVDFALPYDHGSVMHAPQLGPGGLSNGTLPIGTLDPNYQWTIGQRKVPSFLDYKLVNMVYCSRQCPQPLPLCQHGGYEDVNNCKRCRCPTGFGGDFCQRAEMQDGSELCGGELTASNNEAYLKTPNDGSQRCAWLLTANDPNERITLDLEQLDIDCQEVPCSSAYVELKLGPHFETTGYRFCCNQTLHSRHFQSSSNEALVIFQSGGRANSRFSIRYASVRDEVTGPTITTKQPKVPDGCPCDSWSSWTDCTQKCGGCGVQVRQRDCSNSSYTILSNCTDRQSRRCNFEQCQGSKVIWNNGEFHLLFNGCCMGLQAQEGQCKQSPPINAILGTLLNLGGPQ